MLNKLRLYRMYQSAPKMQMNAFYLLLMCFGYILLGMQSCRVVGSTHAFMALGACLSTLVRL